MASFNVTSLNDNEKFALFYGIMLGDGCLSRYATKDERERFAVSITGCAKDDRPFYEKVIVPLLKSFGRKSITIKERKDCGAIELNFPDKLLFDRIKSFGFTVGKKGIDIVIPRYFYDNKLVKFVVAGFMATDGSLVLTKNPNKYYPRIEGNSISSKLIRQITDYLLSIGMNGSFYIAKRKNLGLSYNIQQQYRFQFNGKDNLLLFEKLIGFVNPKHQKKFQDFLEYNNKYDQAIKGIPSQKQKHFRLKTLNGYSRI